MEQNYTLTIIDEIETPLAGSVEMGTNYFVPTAVVVILVAALIIGLIYFLECSKYQKRYDVLVAAHGLNGSAKKCWSITRLKEMIIEEEADAVDAFSEDDFKLS